jgi:hypothetical protein
MKKFKEGQKVWCWSHFSHAMVTSDLLDGTFLIKFKAFNDEYQVNRCDLRLSIYDSIVRLDNACDNAVVRLVKRKLRKFSNLVVLGSIVLLLSTFLFLII